MQVVVGEHVGVEAAALEEGEQDQVLRESVGSSVLGAAITGRSCVRGRRVDAS